MSKQTKIGLAFIFCILGVAGYAAYYKIGPKDLRLFGISLNGLTGGGGLSQAPEDQHLRPTGVTDEPDPFGQFDQGREQEHHRRGHAQDQRAFGEDLFEAQHEPPVGNRGDPDDSWGSSGGRGRRFGDRNSQSDFGRETVPTGGSDFTAVAQNTQAVAGGRFGPSNSLPAAPQPTPISSPRTHPLDQTQSGSRDPFAAGGSGDGRHHVQRPPFGDSQSTAGTNPTQQTAQPPAPSPGKSSDSGWGSAVVWDESRVGNTSQPIKQTALRDDSAADSRQDRTPGRDWPNEDRVSERDDVRRYRTDRPAPTPTTTSPPAQGSDPFTGRYGYGGKSLPENRHTERPAPLPESGADHFGTHRHGSHYGNEHSPDGGAEIYVVQKSDSFWSIAQEKYGTPRYFRALAQFNAQQVPDPLTMRPGIRIVTPSAFVLESRFPDLVPKQPNSNRGAGASGAADLIPAGFFRDATRGPQYRVGKGDTLTAIAYQHLGSAARWMQIFAMNQDVLQNPNSLKIGTVLRLPRDAREVRVATQPAYSR